MLLGFNVKDQHNKVHNCYIQDFQLVFKINSLKGVPCICIRHSLLWKRMLTNAPHTQYDWLEQLAKKNGNKKKSVFTNANSKEFLAVPKCLMYQLLFEFYHMTSSQHWKHLWAKNSFANNQQTKSKKESCWTRAKEATIAHHVSTGHLCKSSTEAVAGRY